MRLEVDASVSFLRTRDCAKAVRGALVNGRRWGDGEPTAKGAEAPGALVAGEAGTRLVGIPIRLSRKVQAKGLGEGRSKGGGGVGEWVVHATRLPPPPPPSAPSHAPDAGGLFSSRPKAAAAVAWVPRSYGADLEVFNAAVQAQRRAREPFCAKCASEHSGDDAGS